MAMDENQPGHPKRYLGLSQLAISASLGIWLVDLSFLSISIPVPPGVDIS
jgi:hypothetical protein